MNQIEQRVHTRGVHFHAARAQSVPILTPIARNQAGGPSCKGRGLQYPHTKASRVRILDRERRWSWVTLMSETSNGVPVSEGKTTRTEQLCPGLPAFDSVSHCCTAGIPKSLWFDQCRPLSAELQHQSVRCSLDPLCAAPAPPFF